MDLIPLSEDLGLGLFGPCLLAQARLWVAAPGSEVIIISTPTAAVGLNEVVAGGSVLTGGSFINLTQREQGILKLNCGMAFWERKSV